MTRGILAGLAVCGLLLAGAGLAAAQAPAAAAEPPVAPSPPSAALPKIQKPDWVRKPTPAQVAAAHPLPHAEGRPTGRVVLSCRVTAAGTLEACGVASETPPDRGFGTAALGLARSFRMKPVAADGSPVTGANVRIPLVFPGQPLELLAFPDWLTKPSYQRLVEVFPPVAASNAGMGRVAMTCRVTRDDRLTACRAVVELAFTPGFDLAALALARDMRLVRTPDNNAPKAGETAEFMLIFNAN
ncbi:energy transducer TonB [Caulobacter sp. NIBR1757]|uniref:energy transducer TonB family protein n=1 Tax=Caulobacter sp. NIBR1757 TaxID=3016000 RepID=UPI0022F05BB5|nr:energy transducer TonB [Caulobacter sp. NIBR1757]